MGDWKQRVQPVVKERPADKRLSEEFNANITVGRSRFCLPIQEISAALCKSQVIALGKER
jgi:hypothetical protein